MQMQLQIKTCNKRKHKTNKGNSNKSKNNNKHKTRQPKITVYPGTFFVQGLVPCTLGMAQKLLALWAQSRPEPWNIMAWFTRWAPNRSWPKWRDMGLSINGVLLWHGIRWATMVITCYIRWASYGAPIIGLTNGYLGLFRPYKWSYGAPTYNW